MLSESELRKIYHDYLIDHPQFQNLLYTDEFPHIKYKVYEQWQPIELKALLIAESPPWKDRTNYFYDPNSENALTRHLFSLLHIEGETKWEKLIIFKSRGYFVIDTLACIFNKNQHEIPHSLIIWSAQQILALEIEELQPSMILAMGNTAFHGLRSIPEFLKELCKYKTLTTISGKKIIINGIKCVFCPYPNDRNRPYQVLIKSAFSQIL
jgi:hypothetical protein